MKSSIKTLFVILAIVMSFVAVQALWAGTGPGYGSKNPSCTEVVEGVVTDVGVEDNTHAIDVVDESGEITTIYGIPVPWLDINEKDYVVVNCFVSPEGKYVACYLTINEPPVIELRP